VAEVDHRSDTASARAKPSASLDSRWRTNTLLDPEGERFDISVTLVGFASVPPGLTSRQKL